jgi:CBS domain-containing protein
MNSLYARDLMQPRVVSIAPGASVIDAAKLMLDCHVTGLPVTDDEGHLVGIITEGDLLRRVEIGTAGVLQRPIDAEVLRQFRKAHGRSVAEVMSDRVASVLGNTPLAEIARLMQLMNYKRVPVTDHGKVVGVIARADILRALVAAAESDSEPAPAQAA